MIGLAGTPADAIESQPRSCTYFRLTKRGSHRVQIRHQRKRGRQPCPLRVFHLYALVGETERPVRTSPVVVVSFLANGRS